MKFEFNKKYNTIAVYSLIVALFGIICVGLCLNIAAVNSFFSKIFNVIKPLLYGLLIAFVLNPGAVAFENKVFKFKTKKSNLRGLRRVLSLVSVYLILALFVTIIVLIIIPQAIDGYEDFQVKISDYIIKARTTIETMIQGNDLLMERYDDIMQSFQDIIDKITGYINVAMPYVYDFLKNLVTEVTNIIIGIVVSIYLLAAREKLLAQTKKFLRAFLSEKNYKKTIEIFTYAGTTFVGYIDGKLLDCVVVGIICFIVLALLSFPYAPLISLIICVMTFIPYIGIFLGALPGALIILISEPQKFFLFTLIILIIALLDIYIFIPRIMGKQVGIPSMWVIISLLFMGGLFGFFGLFIGIPVMALVYNLMRKAINSRLEKKNLPTDTTAYMADLRKLCEEPPKVELNIESETAETEKNQKQSDSDK